MSVEKLIESIERCLEEIKETDWFELTKESKSELNENHNNATFYKFFVSQDYRILVDKRTFDNWKYYLGFEYCEKSSFKYIDEYVLIDCQDDGRLSNFYDECIQLYEKEKEEKTES